MSEEFQVGDVVVCVLSGPTIEQGEIHRIEGFRVGSELSMLGVSELGLFLKGKRSRTVKGSYDARRFQKLPRADEEFTRQIRACKPQHTPAHSGAPQ